MDTRSCGASRVGYVGGCERGATGSQVRGRAVAAVVPEDVDVDWGEGVCGGVGDAGGAGVYGERGREIGRGGYAAGGDCCDCDCDCYGGVVRGW